MEEKTVENLVEELLQLKIDDSQVFKASAIRVGNQIILTTLTANIPVVIQTLEENEDGDLVRARNEKGQYVADNPDTIENEAFKEEE
jgi:hypothetical protein